MSGAATMGRKKNPPPDGQPAPVGEGKYNVSCKLREAFLDKLKLVADDFRVPPGALIEEHMAEWVEAEYLRVLRKRLAVAEGKDRPAGR